jgi:hypothetical protein
MSSALGPLAELARRQHGVVTVGQARAVGVDRRTLRRAVHAGLLVTLLPEVVAFRAAEPTATQSVQAAVLQVACSVASHESALVVRGVDRVPFVVAVSAGPEAHSSRHGIRVHRTRDLLAEHWSVVDGIPCTTLPRTVVDLASVFSRPRLAHLIDRLTITDRRTSIGAIARVLRQVNRSGRHRIAGLQRILDERRPSDPAPRSRLERRADQLLATTSMPVPVAEHPLPGDGEDGFVDRAWSDALLILEIDGRAWHARERSMARDRSRDRAAASAGWLTLRVLDEELESEPDAVLRDLLMTYRSRRDQLRSRIDPLAD